MNNRVIKFSLPAFVLLLLFSSCQRNYIPHQHVLPQPEDTNDKPVSFQDKKTYTLNEVSVSNEFDGARLNGFELINDSIYRVIISPENTPINASSYFAFKLWSPRIQNIELEIFYTEHTHRYWPKLSYDDESWFPIDSTQFDTLKAGNIATLQLEIGPDTLTVAGQELMTSSDNYAWMSSLEKTYPEWIHVNEVGQSREDRPIYCMDIYDQNFQDKPALVIFSRLHPPEVTGYIAMQSFVETLMDSSILSASFRSKYRILVYPMINPDGVDLGHWRHNTGGVDLNRDWSHYRQKEIKAVAYHLTQTVGQSNNDVVLGLDFHSTQEDLYYSFTDNRRSKIYNFKDLWMQGIDESFESYSPDDQPYDLNQPITKAWFLLEFNAESITYEVGDETPRSFVREKARVAAKEMMKLLVLR
ncbi:MAG: hypothetical protein HKN09_03015 [Saprospiraceae bacterium]|nr:hypothetical protein [Saprospiraceae bacterium]